MKTYIHWFANLKEVVRKYTNLPDNILPLCVIPFGYPATKENPKQKFDEKKIHYNQY